MRNDVFWVSLLKEYFANNYTDETVSIALLKEVAKDKQIFNEFTKYLTKKSYDVSNPISVDGVTAKDIAENNPDKKVIEVYIELSKLKNR